MFNGNKLLIQVIIIPSIKHQIKLNFLELFGSKICNKNLTALNDKNNCHLPGN